MEAVQGWAAAVCLTVLAAALVRMLCPEGQFARLMRVILGAFMLCAVVSPFGSFSEGWNTGEYDGVMAQAEEFEEETASRSASLMERSLEQLIGSTLAQNGISFEKITVRMDTDGEDGISIRQIQVTLSHGQDIQQTKTIIRDSLGLETEVTADENR